MDTPKLQYAKTVKLPEYTSQKTRMVPSLALKSLKTQSSVSQLKEFSSTAKTAQDAQMKRAATQGSLFSSQVQSSQPLSKFAANPALLTSSKTLRNSDIRIEPEKI